MTCLHSKELYFPVYCAYEMKLSKQLTQETHKMLLIKTNS
jgi:hypothetical protein